MKHLLSDRNIRSTPVREAVLQIFLNSSHAISHSDIEKQIKGKFDRVTIYRTLAVFLEKGLIHKVLDDKEATKYALCSPDCNSEQHHHYHLHFKCRKCGISRCMEDVEIKTFSLPDGYLLNEINVLAEGICPRCR